MCPEILEGIRYVNLTVNTFLQKNVPHFCVTNECVNDLKKSSEKIISNIFKNMVT